MKKLIFITAFVTAFIFAMSTLAALRVERRDMKLASQALMEDQTIETPVVNGTEDLLDDQASSTAAVSCTLSGAIDVCRNLVITPGGTTADVAAGVVTVWGTNIINESIKEELEFAENASTATTGVEAFCSVTSVLIHKQDGTGATWDIGSGAKLGIKNCMDEDLVVYHTFGGVRSTSDPTITYDADEVEKNTIEVTGIEGTTDIRLFFIQNFRCLP